MLRGFPGVALLLFNPPSDGTYSFNITCGGCKNTFSTEKHRFVVGTQAVLRVTSQPSGAISGALLEQQPAVQLEDRDGRPLHEKARVVASVVPVGMQRYEKG